MTLAQITALGTQTNARMLRASDTGDWYLLDAGQTGAAAHQVSAGGTLTASKAVANAAARLALTLEQAAGFAVIDADTGNSYMLITGGTPATSGDWLQIGDRDVTWAEVDKTGALPSDIGAMADTNAAVNAAIALAPIDTLHTMEQRPIIHGAFGYRVMGRLYDKRAGGIVIPALRLAVLNLGDSLTMKTPKEWEKLTRISGYGGCVEYPLGFGDAGTAAFSPAGYDWNRSICGGYRVVGNGQTLIMNNSRANQIKRFWIISTVESGTRNFKVESSIDGTNWNDITTAVGSGTIGGVAVAANLNAVDCGGGTGIASQVVEWEFTAAGYHQIRITGTAATASNIWFIGYSDMSAPNVSNVFIDQRGGVDYFSCGSSSLDIDGADTAAQHLFDALFQTINPEIVTWKANDSAYTDHMPPYMAKVDLALGISDPADDGVDPIDPLDPDRIDELKRPEWWFIGPNPNRLSIGPHFPDEEWGQPEKDLRDIAVSTRNAYIDSRAILRNVPLMTDFDMMALGHSTGYADAILMSYVVSRLESMMPDGFTKRFPPAQGLRGKLEILESVAGTGGIRISREIGNNDYSVSWDAIPFGSALWTKTQTYYTHVQSIERHFFGGHLGFGLTLGSGLPNTDLGMMNLNSGNRNNSIVKCTGGTSHTSADFIKCSRNAAATTAAGTYVFGVGNNGEIKTSRVEMFAPTRTVTPEWIAGTNPPTPQTVTISIANPGVVTLAGHGLSDGTKVKFATSDANLPTGIVAGDVYFIVLTQAGNFRIADTYNGAAIETTGSQSGTHTVEVVAPNGSLYSMTGGTGALYVCESGAWVLK